MGSNTPGPLQGQRIVITRQSTSAADFAQRLEALGASAIICPAIRIEPPEDWQPLDRALRQLASYDWLIITSANTVHNIMERANAHNIRLLFGKLKIAAVGPATARSLQEAGLNVDFMPPKNVADSLLEHVPIEPGNRVLLPQADLARPLLREELAARGTQVDSIIAYRTVLDERAGDLAERLNNQTVDLITFLSSSAVRNTLTALELAGVSDPLQLLRHVRLASIGPITSATIREIGLQVHIEAREHTINGLIRALCADR